MTPEEYMVQAYKDLWKSRERQAECDLMQRKFEIINDTLQACLVVQNAQLLGLMYAGMNPNFCKPK